MRHFNGIYSNLINKQTEVEKKWYSNTTMRTLFKLILVGIVAIYFLSGCSHINGRDQQIADFRAYQKLTFTQMTGQPKTFSGPQTPQKSDFLEVEIVK